MALASITEQITEGKTLPITDKELRLQSIVRLDTGNVLILNLASLLTPYRYQLKKMMKRYRLSEKDNIVYQYKPWALSHDLYGTIELAPMILQINGMISCSEFTNLHLGINLFTGAILDFINEVMIKDAGFVKRNRTVVRKELATND